MGNRVRKKPLPGKALSSGRRQKRAGPFMHEEGHIEIDYGSVKRIVIGVVDVAPFDRVGPNKNSFETELVDRALRFIDGELYVLYRKDGNAHQAPAIRRAIIVKPVVVGA